MSKKLYEENDIKDIANAIRKKNNSSTKYAVSDMATAINNIEGGAIYTFPDGSSFNFKDLKFGTHACDGTIIPIIASISRSPAYSKTISVPYSVKAEIPWSENVSIPWSQSVSDSLKYDLGKGKVVYSGSNSYANNSGSKSSGNGLTIQESNSYSAGWGDDSYGPYCANMARVSSSATATFSKTITGTATKAISGTATKTYTGNVSGTATGNATYTEDAIFLPLYKNSLSECASYTGGTAKAWIVK